MGKDQVRVFRATAEAWIGRFLLPLIFCGLLIVTAVNAASLHPWLGAIGLSILLAVGLFLYALPMLRDFLACDGRSLECHLDGQTFRVYWTEVLAAWRIEQRRKRFVCLGTRQGTAVIPLHFFDAQAVWDEVSARVLPEALEPSAVQRLPDYREWEAAQQNEQDAEIVQRRVVDHWGVQLVGWAGISLVAAALISGWLHRNIDFAPLLVLGILVATSLINGWGITEFNQDGVTRRTLWNTLYIRWEEVRWMEIDPFDTTLVLGGSDKCVVLSGPALWLGTGRKEALSLLLSQVEQRSIPLRRTLLATFRISKNARKKKP